MIEFCKNINQVESFKSYHLFVIRLPNRDIVRTELEKNNIETGIHYPISLPKLEAYRYLNSNFDHFIACKIDSQLLSLPMHEMLLSNEIDSTVTNSLFFSNIL